MTEERRIATNLPVKSAKPNRAFTVAACLALLSLALCFLAYMYAWGHPMPMWLPEIVGPYWGYFWTLPVGGALVSWLAALLVGFQAVPAYGAGRGLERSFSILLLLGIVLLGIAYFFAACALFVLSWVR